MIALVLQARLDSRRLPGKALLPLGGKPMIGRVMEALKQVKADAHVLACPEECVKNFTALAEEQGFTVIGGPKEDVLGRYALALRKTQADTCIRATGDNPFVFIDALEAITQEALERGADYAGFSGLPLGAGVEVVSAEALFRAEREAQSPYEREHVCPYLYGHGEIFRLHRPLAPRVWQGGDLRFTVDTPEDYRRAEELFQLLQDAPQEAGRGEMIIPWARKLGAS